MPTVEFIETRQIRTRDHKTIQWRAGERYEYDPEMEPMIKIGHAKIVEFEPSPAAVATIGQKAQSEHVVETVQPIKLLTRKPPFAAETKK